MATARNLDPRLRGCRKRHGKCKTIILGAVLPAQEAVAKQKIQQAKTAPKTGLGFC
jgi:hypothetical protein